MLVREDQKKPCLNWCKSLLGPGEGLSVSGPSMLGWVELGMSVHR